MGISDTIAEIIERLLEEGDGRADIRRNDLAGQIGCAPSQINYVISSRFTPERGLVIESRRGGGGYVRIIRKTFTKSDYLMHLFAGVGSEIDSQSAEAIVADMLYSELVSLRESRLIRTALKSCGDDASRADLFRQLILGLL